MKYNIIIESVRLAYFDKIRYNKINCFVDQR